MKWTWMLVFVAGCSVPQYQLDNVRTMYANTMECSPDEVELEDRAPEIRASGCGATLRYNCPMGHCYTPDKRVARAAKANRARELEKCEKVWRDNAVVEECD